MNQNLDEKQARFQHNDIPHRLGHIASNLARVRSFCNIAHKEAVVIVIDETQWFIKWTLAEIEPSVASELVDIEVQLSQWKSTWDDIWSNKKVREIVAQQADIWSQRVLDMSGLLESIA